MKISVAAIVERAKTRPGKASRLSRRGRVCKLHTWPSATAQRCNSICAANDRSAVGYMSSRKGGPDANRRGPLSGGVELMKRSSAAVAQRSPLWGRFNKVGIGLSSGTNLPGPSQGEGRVWVN
jgi:hypothetical protein